MDTDWKLEFPALAGSEVAYFDSASTCQVPLQVIDRVTEYLRSGHGNPHRGMYTFSEKAENIQQTCREKIANFIHCQSHQIAFTKGTTESINIVASSLRNQLDGTHTILVTQMEHHANLLPWQRLCQQTGARLNVLPIAENGSLDLTHFDQLLMDNCALFAVTHCSNVLGTINPLQTLLATVKRHAVATLVDGAQLMAHQAVDVSEIDCDFYAFSGHKLYAPGGVGVLYCKQPDALQPLLLGGGIVDRVTTQGFQLIEGIEQLEAGSANMPGIVGLSAALDFVNQIGFENIAQRENQLMTKIVDLLDKDIFRRVSHIDSQNLLSIVSSQFHSHDIASILAAKNVAVRAGHHCAQPCLNALGLSHCVRISIGLYNDERDVDLLISALSNVSDILM